MMGQDLVQVLVGASCVICVTPLLILWAMLRLTVALERFLLRHSLLLWLFPVALWLKAVQQEESQNQWEQYNGNGCRRS